MAKEATHGGEYRRMMLERSGQYREEGPTSVSFFLLRFYVCLALFIGFCIFDYTKASVYSCDSRRILSEIQRDGIENLDLESLDLKEAAAGLWKSVRITEE